MALEGELVVRIETGGGHVTALTARADRPRVGPRLFVGRPARDVPGLARSLFSICGRSQAIAARTAVRAAGGMADAEEDAAARDRVVAAETLQEHAWKIFVDTPTLLGFAPAIEALAEGRQAIAALMDAGTATDVEAASESVLAWARNALFDPEEFAGLSTLEGLQAWALAQRTAGAGICARALAADPTLGACDIPLLPPASAAWIAGELACEIDARGDFDERPSLRGRPHETGAVARMAGHPLIAAVVSRWGRGTGARLVARLLETAELIKGTGSGTRPLDRHGAAATSDGEAVSWAETARGLLVHRVRLDGDRVAAYRIVAPTEWNFHPQGAFAHGAASIRGDDGAIEADVRRLVASLDPCVGVRYEARHA